MDDHSLLTKIFDFIGGAAMAYAGWLNLQIRDMKKEQTDHRIKVAEDYVTKKEHSELATRIDGKLDRILDKLDEKADKE